jgi:hypothetical protein
MHRSLTWSAIENSFLPHTKNGAVQRLSGSTPSIKRGGYGVAFILSQNN